jgi:anti-sigma factor RsiW
MSSTRDHISSTQLDAYLDGTVSRADRLLIEQHLGACNVCKSAYDGAVQIEEAMRTLPQERVGRTFTRAVLQSLRLVPQTSLAFRLLEKIAYLFGFMIVVTVMLTVFTATGVIQWGEISEAHSAAGKAASGLLPAVSAGADAVAHFVQTFLPFAFPKTGGGIVLAAVAAAALIALVDVVLGKRIPQR